MDNTTFGQQMLRDVVMKILEILKIIVQGLMDNLSFKNETKTGYVAYDIS